MTQGEDMARLFASCDVAIVDVQEDTGTTWVRDLSLDEALRLAAYWRDVPGFRAYAYPNGGTGARR